MTNLPTALDSELLYNALMGRVERKMRTHGEVILPCAPSLLDEYLRRLIGFCALLGKRFSEAEERHLREILEPRLKRGFEASPHSIIRFTWKPEDPPGSGIDYTISLEITQMTDHYESWVQTRTPPLFGAHADAKALAVAASLGAPADCPILDIGAGTGRNSIPLARLGHPVTALETTAAFVNQLTTSGEGLPLRALQGNILDPGLELPKGEFAMVLVSEVCSLFRTLENLRTLYQRVAETLRPGGAFVVNAFVAASEYEPGPLAREVAELTWSSFFTGGEVRAAGTGLPLRIESSDSVHDFERANLPADAWPPTGWFQDWSRGYDTFKLVDHAPPIHLRWLVYRRTES